MSGPGGDIFFLVVAGLCIVGAVRLALGDSPPWPWIAGLLVAAAALGTVAIWSLRSR